MIPGIPGRTKRNQPIQESAEEKGDILLALRQSFGQTGEAECPLF
jgi:hypothetical protein